MNDQIVAAALDAALTNHPTPERLDDLAPAHREYIAREAARLGYASPEAYHHAVRAAEATKRGQAENAQRLAVEVRRSGGSRM